MECIIPLLIIGCFLLRLYSRANIKNDPDQLGCKFSKGSYYARTRTCNEVAIHLTYFIIYYGGTNFFSCCYFTAVPINKRFLSIK